MIRARQGQEPRRRRRALFQQIIRSPGVVVDEKILDACGGARGRRQRPGRWCVVSPPRRHVATAAWPAWVPARQPGALEPPAPAGRATWSKPGDNIVLVVTASAAPRGRFAAAEFLMDYLKTSAPFWKKERGPDGASAGSRPATATTGLSSAGRGRLSGPGRSRAGPLTRERHRRGPSSAERHS